MNDCSVPVGGPRERMPRRMYGLSLFCVFAGLALLIGGFIVLSTSVFDEMNARAHLVIPGGYAVMSDYEFIRSVLPVAGVAGAIHLAGVIAGFVGRRYAEDRAEIGRCALGVGVNAFFLGCAGIIPAAGLSAYPGSLAVLLAVCGGAVLSACFSLFERFFSSAGAKSVGVERCLSAWLRSSTTSLRRWKTRSCPVCLSWVSSSSCSSPWVLPS